MNFIYKIARKRCAKFEFCNKSGVLDDDESDVLVNVNMIDEEKANKNIEKKKAKPGYTPFDDDQTDEFGNVSSSDEMKS